MDAFAAAGIEAVVAAKPSTLLPDLRVPVLREPERPRRPLAGVVKALRESAGRAVVVAPCDVRG